MLVIKRIATKSTRSILAPILNGGSKPVAYSKIITSGLPDVEIPEISLNEYVLENSPSWENRTAVECAVTGRHYTYNQLRTKSKNLSGSLRKKLKLEKGDVIAILLPNIPEYAIVALGALRAGLICTTVNPIYTPEQPQPSTSHLMTTTIEHLPPNFHSAAPLPEEPQPSTSSTISVSGTFNSPLSLDETREMRTEQCHTAEIARQLLDSSAKALITLNELWTLAVVSKNLTKKDIPILSVKMEHGQALPAGAINFAEFVDNEVDYPEVNTSPNDVALLPYSSGTTGLPKGVQLTHSNIVSNLCQLEHPLIGCSQKTTANHQDVTPAVLPMFHIYGLTILCMYQLRLGCKVVTLPKFTPELYVNTLRKQKPHVLYLAPPIAIFLANHPSVKEEDFSSVRTMTNGAAPLGVLDAAKLLKKANKYIPLLQGYGLTETSPVVLTTRISQLSNKNIVGALGLPVPNTEVKIIGTDDTTGTPLGPNQIGELLVKGPQVMKGYLDRPDENIFLDGWMRTGDMMYYNDEGFLFITDRLKELIKVKGFQVAPAELEEIIRDFPNVVDAAVIGVPHDTHGEVPRAYVVPQQGTNIPADKLKQYVDSQVAPYKHIRGGISFVNSIPKNAAGKILRRELKVLYEKEINK